MFKIGFMVIIHICYFTMAYLMDFASDINVSYMHGLVNMPDLATRSIFNVTLGLLLTCLLLNCFLHIVHSICKYEICSLKGFPDLLEQCLLCPCWLPFSIFLQIHLGVLLALQGYVTNLLQAVGSTCGVMISCVVIPSQLDFSSSTRQFKLREICFNPHSIFYLHWLLSKLYREVGDAGECSHGKTSWFMSFHNGLCKNTFSVHIKCHTMKSLTSSW